MTDPKWDPVEEIEWSALQLTEGLEADASYMTKREIIMFAQDMGEQILEALQEVNHEPHN